jgi:hypothetical protein
LENREHNLVGPLTFDELVLHEVGFLVKTGLFQRPHRRSIATIASPDDSVKVILIEGQFQQGFVDFGGVSQAVVLRVQRTADLTLTMLIVVPAQHEISNEALGITQFDGDEQSVVDIGVFGEADSLFEQLFGLLAGTGHAVEVSIDGLVFEDSCEVVEVASFESSNDQTPGTDGASELGHPHVLAPDVRDVERDVLATVKGPVHREKDIYE